MFQALLVQFVQIIHDYSSTHLDKPYLVYVAMGRDIIPYDRSFELREVLSSP